MAYYCHINNIYKKVVSLHIIAGIDIEELKMEMQVNIDVIKDTTKKKSLEPNTVSYSIRT